MKGILLAGGNGSRLRPITFGASKQLLPIYDKPMIYYPLSILMQAGIRDILIISTPIDIVKYKGLLKDGKHFGVNLEYAIQPSPDGIAQAFLLGEKFLGSEAVCLILGDNLFYGQNLQTQLKNAAKLVSGGHIFGCEVKNPERFGVIEFDNNGKVRNIEEKPKEPKSNHIVTGLYFYDNHVIEITKNLKPSDRGELEITDINSEYLQRNELKVTILDKTCSWLDTGTYDSLLDASIFIRKMQNQKHSLIGSIEQIAFENSWIDKSQLKSLSLQFQESSYGKQLNDFLETEK